MSDKLKHTPGSWHAGCYSADAPNVIINVHGNGRAICTFPTFLRKSVGTETNKANAELIALAPTAPHHCEDPACPGDINRRKLEAFDQVREALQRMHDCFGGTEDLIADARAALAATEWL